MMDLLLENFKNTESPEKDKSTNQDTLTPTLIFVLLLQTSASLTSSLGQSMYQLCTQQMAPLSYQLTLGIFKA